MRSFVSRHRDVRLLTVLAPLICAAVIAGCGSSSNNSSSSSSGGSSTSPSSTTSSSSKPVNIAFLTFAVANTYDAPMLAAAKSAAASAGAKLTVMDANNNPSTQLSQLEAATSSGQYNGLIVEPIFGPGLLSAVKTAISKGIKVANVDETLGSNYTTDASPLPGLSANIVFVSSDLGSKMGKLAVQACTAKHYSPCTVGFLYDFKATPFDIALRQGFNSAIAGHNVQVVAEGQDMYSITAGASASQTMMAAHPNLDLIVGTDQGIEGAARVVPSRVTLIGYGGSAAALAGIKSGRWYGTVMQEPATAGKLAVEDLVKAVRNGQTFAGMQPNATQPDGGLVTKANVGMFHAEWQG